MEGVTFRQPQIAEVLRSRFVESRLHMDYPDRIEGEKYAVHRRLQQELVGTTAVPQYAVLDPVDGEFLVRHRLFGADHVDWAADFLRLFELLPAKKH